MKKINNNSKVVTRNDNSKKSNKERGITLVALVITIVILIILATVTINAVIGDNGLINQAEQAKDYSSNSTESEYEGMNRVYAEYANVMEEDKEIPIFKSEIQRAKESGEIFEETTELEDDSGDSVWIPGGFGVAEDSATDADDGVVITDGTNEFVWIPVPDYTTMYEDTQGSVTLNGVTTTTSVYSKLRIRNGDMSDYTAGIPGITTSGVVKEPDVLSSYDTDEQNYSILGYSSTQEMADAMVEEYIATYNSIKKYKGFYIGRYEITGTVDSPTVQKGQVVLAEQNWYNLKKACTKVVSTEYAQSEMIYGNQWDEVMSWLVSTGAKTEEEVNEDSSSWGNYNDSTGEASTGSVGQRVSGYSESWKANNIYDLAGNSYEWTQEASNTYGRRITRGR